MTRRVEHPACYQEFEDAVRYYAAINPKLAVQFATTVDAFRERITQNPQLYAIRKLNIRRVNLTPRFDEWYLAYMICEDRIVVLAIGHAKQRPFYFHNRVGEAEAIL